MTTQFVRAMHYPDLGSEFKPPYPLPVTPETFPLQSQPKGSTKGTSIKLSDAWYAFDKALNPTNHWLTNIQAMLFNSADNPKMAESITDGGNILEIDYEQNGHGHVLAFKNDTDPSVYNVKDYFSYPQFIHKVVCITRSNQLVNPGANLNVYFALVGNPDLWVDMSMVEKFPALQMMVQPQWWALPWLNIRDAPYGNAVAHLLPTDKALLIGYDPRGSDVWGRVQLASGLEGWIALLKGGVEFTNWHMATQAPPMA